MDTSASRLQLPAGTWATVLDCLCDRFPRVTREQWLDRMRRGRVQDAAGAPLDPHTAFRVGMEVRYFREVAVEAAIPFLETVLHHDDHLLVADKPHFLPVVPAGGHVEHTLLARLRRATGNAALVPLHRIDRDTAGLVMFSVDARTRGRYQALFRDRRIDKSYLAVAKPLPDLAWPQIRQSRIVRGEPFFRMCETPGVPNSETLIHVIERHDAWWRYRLQPVSGRKHQLRIHMAALGAPILHDRYYPELQPAIADDDFSRPLQLLAHALAFDDPLTGRRREFNSSRVLESGSPGSISTIDTASGDAASAR